MDRFAIWLLRRYLRRWERRTGGPMFYIVTDKGGTIYALRD